jgi:hypothetical protein
VADFHFEYDEANKIFAVRMTGSVTDDVFRMVYASVARYLEGREVRAALIDLSSMTAFDVSAAAVRQVSAQPAPIEDPTPRYIIATEAHVFGMARMFQIVAAHGIKELHVVRSVQDAHDALGLAATQFERLA